MPLGGTSNHFRREILVRLGGWDPFNVTEDADLGVRLHRLGFRTGVLDSTTLEEANSDLVNWTKQRSRWYKGYLQTWLVHMRHPRQLWQQLGTKGFIGFNLFVGGTPFLAMLNPVFWAMTALWFMARPPIILELFPAWLYYTSLVVPGRRELRVPLHRGGRCAGPRAAEPGLRGAPEPGLLGDDVGRGDQGHGAARRCADVLGKDGPRPRRAGDRDSRNRREHGPAGKGLPWRGGLTPWDWPPPRRGG